MSGRDVGARERRDKRESPFRVIGSGRVERRQIGRDLGRLGRGEAKIGHRRAGRNLRTNALHMTSDGEAAIDAMLDAIGKSDRRMSARLTEAERRSLFTLLHKLGAPRASRTHGGSRTES